MNGEKLGTLVGIQVIYEQVILSLMIKYEEEEGSGPQFECLPSRGIKAPPGNKEDHEHAEFTIDGRAGEHLTGVYAYKYSDLVATSSGDEDMGDAPPGDMENLGDPPPEGSEDLDDAPPEETWDLDDSSPEDIAVIRVRKSSLASVSANTHVYLTLRSWKPISAGQVC